MDERGDTVCFRELLGAFVTVFDDKVVIGNSGLPQTEDITKDWGTNIYPGHFC